jgi:hypothetical protein
MADICVRAMIVGPWFGRVEFTLAWPDRQRMQAAVELLYRCPYTRFQAVTFAAQCHETQTGLPSGCRAGLCGVFELACAEQ